MLRACYGVYDIKHNLSEPPRYHIKAPIFTQVGYTSLSDVGVRITTHMDYLLHRELYIPCARYLERDDLHGNLRGLGVIIPTITTLMAFPSWQGPSQERILTDHSSCGILKHGEH